MLQAWERKPVERYISGVKVIWSDKRSAFQSNVLKELNGGSFDINYYAGGKYVWLIPEYTTRREEACTLFEVVIRDNHDPGLVDLAAGAGGQYRYLTCRRDENEEKIRRLALYRGPQFIALKDAEKKEIDGWSTDINEGRNLDFLHLVWSKGQKSCHDAGYEPHDEV
ncbi:hypothetical protein CDD81_4290 [Ophiocordyceps australis]|uniref:Uncharacterized protein n=1 Tax=Ophiocordyceps australis TaxID=1399860 RepID=A0A2C5YCA6_9HYPO|nr:hypothetical protein CDD81_4290 [Ophiocordyceps australis]